MLWVFIMQDDCNKENVQYIPSIILRPDKYNSGMDGALAGERGEWEWRVRYISMFIFATAI